MTALELERRVAEAWPADLCPSQTVVLAVSGGADSVAMLRATHVLELGNIVVGHVHHGLRGEAADRDAEFVRDLCRQLDVECRVGHVDGSSQGDGVEAAARDARYSWLANLAESMTASYIATAHTADDQAETIIHRIVRGTGIGGLAGIPATRELTATVTVFRPLLACTRGQIESYLADVDQLACDDETNRDTAMTRNRIRHELLPLVEGEYNPQVRDALLRLGALAGEVQAVVDSQVAELFHTSCLVTSEWRVILKPSPLARVDAYVIRELLIHVWKQQRWPLQGMSYDHWQRLVAMVRDATAQAEMLPGSVRAEKQGEQLVLTRPVDD